MWCLTKTVAAIVGVACGLVACRGGESLSESPEAEDFESASLYDPAHVASLPDAAFVVEADIAAMTELGIVRPDDPYLPFSFVEDVPRLFDICGSALPSGVTEARTAYYRLEDEVTVLSRRRRYGAITALTGKVDWEPLIECLRRVPAAAPVTFGQLEGVRVELDDPTTCEPELAATVIADGPVLYVGDPELLQKHLVHAMRAKALDQAPTGIAERWAGFTKGKVLSAIFVETPPVFYQLNYFFPTKGETQAVFMGLERAGDGSELRAVATVPQGDSKDTRRWVARFLDAAETALHPGRATQPPGDLVGKYGESAVSFTRVVTSAWARELALGDAGYLLWRMRAAKREPQETQVHPKPRTYSPITVPTDILQSTAKLADAHAGPVSLSFQSESFDCENGSTVFRFSAGGPNNLPNLEGPGQDRIRYSILGMRDHEREPVMKTSCPALGSSWPVRRGPAVVRSKEGVLASDVAFVDGTVLVDFPTRIERVRLTSVEPGTRRTVNGTTFEVLATFDDGLSYLVSGKVSNLLEVRRLNASGQVLGGGLEDFRDTDRGYLGAVRVTGDLASIELFIIADEALMKYPFELPIAAKAAPRDAEAAPPVFEPFSMADFRRKIVPNAARHLNKRQTSGWWFDRHRTSAFELILTTWGTTLDIYLPPMPNVVGTFGQLALYIDSVRLKDGTTITSADPVKKGRGGERTKWDKWFSKEPTWSQRLWVEQNWQGRDDPLIVIRTAGGLSLRTSVAEFSARLEFRIPTAVRWHALDALRAGEIIEDEGFKAHIEQVYRESFGLHVTEGARRVVAVYAVGGALKAPKALKPTSPVPTLDTWTKSFDAPAGSRIFVGVADDFESETRSITFHPKPPSVKIDATKRH